MPPIRFPRAALEAIIDGCEMDLQRVRYERAEDLYPYCYRVASAVGLCCVEIFGYTDPRAREYAVQLGTALQLTNIIRDVGTDAKIGRVYLPQQDLKEFGVSEDDLVAGRYDDRFVRLMEHQAARARGFYARGRCRVPGGRRALAGAGRDHGAHLPRPARGDRGPALPGLRRPHHGAGPTQGRDRRPLLGRRALPAQRTGRVTPPRSMRAAVLDGAGRIAPATWARPAVGPGELLLRLRGCGLCGSDIAKIVESVHARALGARPRGGR